MRLSHLLGAERLAVPVQLGYQLPVAHPRIIVLECVNVLTTLTLAAREWSYNPIVSRTPGTYTQFGIWTIDTLDVYSIEKVSNSIYCNVTACTAPTLCTVSAPLSEGNVTLSWSGASGGAGNPITSYEIQYSNSPDNSNWGAWLALATVNTSATSSILNVSPPATRGHYRRFRIRTVVRLVRTLLRMGYIQQYCS